MENHERLTKKRRLRSSEISILFIFIVALLYYGIMKDCSEIAKREKTMANIYTIHDMIMRSPRNTNWCTLRVIKAIEDNQNFNNTKVKIKTHLDLGSDILVFKEDGKSVSIKIIDTGRSDCQWLANKYMDNKFSDADFFVNGVKIDGEVLGNGHLNKTCRKHLNTLTFRMRDIKL